MMAKWLSETKKDKNTRQGMDIDIIRQIEQPINTLLEKMEGCSEFLMM
jgi:hypothetical protein